MERIRWGAFPRGQSVRVRYDRKAGPDREPDGNSVTHRHACAGDTFAHDRANSGPDSATDAEAAPDNEPLRPAAPAVLLPGPTNVPNAAAKSSDRLR